METINRINQSIFLKIALSKINITRQQTFGSLKPLQTKSLISALNSDVLSILPTGYGKSLIFEILPRFVDICKSFNHVNQVQDIPLTTASAIILITPLNSIIYEQIQRYGDQAIEVGPSFLAQLKIHHSLCMSPGNATPCNCGHTIRKFLMGGFRYLIGHPEAFLAKLMFTIFRDDMFQNKIKHIVVDEAHCIDMWGDKFRIDFKDIEDLR